MRKGFTLIELIISTAVILMMLAVTLPAFLSFQRRQSLVIAGQVIRDVILETQNYALAPRGGEGEGKATGADQYRIIFINDPDQPGYEIGEEKVDDVAFGKWLTIRRGRLPFDISFRCFPDPGPGSNNQPVPELYTSSTAAPVPAADDSKGLVYSIKKLGKIVSPQPVSGQLSIVLKQKSLPDEQLVKIDIQTGRVDVEPNLQDSLCI